MERKLFAIDMDGTLLNNKGVVSQYTKDILKKATNQGHIICLITGRTLNMAKEQYIQSGLKTPIGLFNGAVIHSYVDNDFKSEIRTLKLSRVKEVVCNDLLIAMSNGMTIETLNNTYISHIDDGTLVSGMAIMGTPTFCKNLNFIKEDIIIVLAELITKSGEVAEEIKNKIKETYPDLEISHWYSYENKKYMIEISSLSSRKDFALMRLAKHFGIDIKNTIAFGDGANDSHMLMTAGKGFAMKNAPSFVKRFADTITKFTNEEDGVAKEIEKLI